MTVPAGFSVKLLAAEPDVRQPIGMCFDDRGRLWVAECYAYPHKVDPAEARDRILIFEDTDGDHAFDKRTVFKEGLNLVSGIEVGFGGVWVGAAPYLMFIPKDANDKAGEPTILLDGFSKTFAMTGWRLGYASLPEALREPITRLIINSVSCTAPATQLAGVAALTGPRTEIDAMMAEFDRRRAAVVEGLNSLPGVTCRDPKGAFYAFPNVTGTGQDGKIVADRLLQEAGVAVLSGTAFGEHGDGYLRLSYANSMENIQEAIEAMRGLLETMQA
jgi:DNA-binding transcriptional MocR family regulator